MRPVIFSPKNIAANINVIIGDAEAREDKTPILPLPRIQYINDIAATVADIDAAIAHMIPIILKDWGTLVDTIYKYIGRVHIPKLTFIAHTCNGCKYFVASFKKKAQKPYPRTETNIKYLLDIMLRPKASSNF